MRGFTVSQKMFTRLADSGIKNILLMLKTLALIFESKANLNNKILFDKIACL